MASNPLYEAIKGRMRRAQEAGWVIEDTRLTPGIPTYGARRPDGSIAGVLGWFHRADDFENFVKQMDRVGVPA